MIFRQPQQPGKKMTKVRKSGILLHITSLPSEYGVGDLGPGAYRFADLLKRAKQTCWQVLPLNQPPVSNYPSPYSVLSAFAGNTLLISPELLCKQGLLTRKDIQDRPDFPKKHVNYHAVIPYKTRLLNKAFERFQAMPKNSSYAFFCSQNKSWLDDYALFIALRRHFSLCCWRDWPAELRDRNKQALKSVKLELKDDIEHEKFLQYLFFRQWFSLKHYCNKKDIRIIGDIPIYVTYDSADVWSGPEIFKLTKSKKLRVVSGVPPDFFCKTGQLWGNPVYDWQALKDRGYNWWLRRVRHNLSLFDLVRLDHFRGFIAYWQVPAGHKTAAKGRWVKGPGQDFFGKLLRHFPSCPFIAEDLGHITPAVKRLIKKFEIPSMKVLQYGFDGNWALNSHCPGNYIANSVVYTGTHDNNTIKGWFDKEATLKQKKNLFRYLGRKVPTAQIHWEMVRLAMSSISGLAVIPMQDVLGLGSQARMNRPGTLGGNWTWRLAPGQITAAIAYKLAKLTQTYGRA